MNFFSKIQGLSRTSQGPYEPCVKETCTRVGTVQREWQTSCCCARNCDELASNFPCKFLVQVIAQASPAYKYLVLVIRCNETPHRAHHITSRCEWRV